MLHLITGTPGSGKTLYAVYLIDKQETANKQALEYNAKVYKENLAIIEQHDLSNYFFTYTYFSKIFKDYVTETFDDNYFNYLSEKVRTRNIFLDITFYNGILKNIRNDLDINLKTLKPVRHIFSNIDGLKVDNVQPVEINWQLCPDGSVIFYDEIQLIKEYSAENKQDPDGIIKMLTVHRHRAFDIYGITQFPRLVATGFRDVVGLHYHLHRGWGAPSATVYVWANCREKPNSLGNKFTAERDFRFNYPKRLYEIYESATANTHKLRVPLKLFAILLIPLFGLLMLFSTLFSDNQSFLSRIFGSEKEQKHQTQSKEHKQENKQQTTAQQTTDEQASASSPVLTNYDQNTKVDYDPTQPFSDLSKQVSYVATSKPVFSGCIKYNKKYYAYTEQGTKLNVSQDDCKKLIENGERPYNYFHVEKEIKQTNQDNQNIDINPQNKNKMTADQYVKYLEYLEQTNQADNTIQETQTLTYSKDINADY